MHVHENRHIKRAGVAGKALRASAKVFLHSPSVQVAILRGLKCEILNSVVAFKNMKDPKTLGQEIKSPPPNNCSAKELNSGIYFL